MKIGHGIITAFITNVQHGVVGFLQELTGITNPYFIEKVNIGFLRAAFEVIAKGGHTHTGNSGFLRQRNGIAEGINGKLEYPVNIFLVFQG